MRVKYLELTLFNLL